MDCPCRDCIFSGRFGGDATKPGYLCPYTKQLALKAFEDIKQLIGALGTLIDRIDEKTA
jgi:hypothetical protein